MPIAVVIEIVIPHDIARDISSRPRIVEAVVTPVAPRVEVIGAA